MPQKNAEIFVLVTPFKRTITTYFVMNEHLDIRLCYYIQVLHLRDTLSRNRMLLNHQKRVALYSTDILCQLLKLRC